MVRTPSKELLFAWRLIFLAGAFAWHSISSSSTISDTKESDDIVESSGSTISSVVGGIIVDSDDKRATSRSSSWMTPALSAAHSDAVAHLCRWSSFYGVGNGYLWLWLDGGKLYRSCSSGSL
ncbi:hypothetical protein GUJ93_ZPchr0005g15855 [Zizania palustris]|uniref:Secreted protein n=1 Tax=Zizania palustris TaxID=103762 RepID=A0A8J5SG42_ZIZPA|nr:hypothetical protein GUJ93_ZPchr0005g15855 [Zizania palustris]